MARELESPWMAGEYGDDCSPSRAIEWQHPCQNAPSARMPPFANILQFLRVTFSGWGLAMTHYARANTLIMLWGSIHTSM